MATKEYHKVSLYRETATLTDESITPGAPSGTLKLGASGNFGVHTLQVELGEGWQGLTVHAIFWLNGAGVLGNSLLSGGEISVPAAVTASPTNVGFVTFSGTSSGVNRLTATLPFIVTDGPPSEGEPSPDPDPSLWQQLFDKMEEVVSTYILPIMSEETLGGGRAIKKTTETVPVAVDPLDGRLYVPEQSGGGGDYKLPQATESTLGGIKAKQRTSETLEVAIDEATGKLYVPQQGGGGSYVLPVATEGVLGGVKAPAKTSETVKVVVDADGFLYIKDYAEKSAIPTKVSQLQNDSNFLTKESDPTVSEWAKQPQKPTYTADEVGAQAKGDYALKNEIPTKLPNPQRLTFTGAVNKTYDGSSAVTVNIPTGGGGGGETGAAAGFGTPTATASALEPGTQPTVQIEASGPDTAKIFAFTFGIPKGQDGAPGEPGKNGQDGAQGPAGPAGTTDYNALSNKPSIGGVTIEGDKTAADYGLAAKDFSLIRKIEITSPEQQVVSFTEDISKYSEIIIKGIPVSKAAGSLVVKVIKDGTTVCSLSFGPIATDTTRNTFGIIRRTSYGFVMTSTNQNNLNGATANLSNLYGEEIPAEANISVILQNSSYGKKFIEGTELYIYGR